MTCLQIYTYAHHLDWLSVFIILVLILTSSFFSVVFKDTLFLFLKYNERKATFLCYQNPRNFFLWFPIALKSPWVQPSSAVQSHPLCSYCKADFGAGNVVVLPLCTGNLWNKTQWREQLRHPGSLRTKLKMGNECFPVKLTCSNQQKAPDSVLDVLLS